MDEQEESPISELELDLVDDPMDPLDPSPCNPTARKRPLWLRDTLQNVKRHVVARQTFKKSKKPCQYQGYVVAMSNIMQAKPWVLKKQ